MTHAINIYGADMNSQSLQQHNEYPFVQIAYTSSAGSCFDKAELDTLLQGARDNNAKIGVSGVLLYDNGSFFQIIEGPPNVTESLYEHIQKDPRHDHVVLVVRRSIKQRNFANWSMGFVREVTTLAEQPGYVDFFHGHNSLDLEGDSALVRKILEKFKRGLWHQTVSA